LTRSKPLWIKYTFIGCDVILMKDFDKAGMPQGNGSPGASQHELGHAIEQSGFSAGVPLMIMAAESASTNERLNTACREAYASMQAAFADKFSGNKDLAQFVMATLEGAILLSRVQHSGDPLRRIVGQLETYIRSMEMNN